MRRRLNSTGRQKITAENIAIRLLENQGRAERFEANLSGLTALGLDADARVVVEAYVKTSSMRFDFGTVGMLRHPSDTALVEIDRGASILFRVKVIDVTDVPGRLLAASGPVRPLDESDEDDDRKSLLPMREVDLGEEIWRIDVEAKPELLLNRAVPDLAQRLTTDPVLQGAIFPVVVRTIMKTLLQGAVSDDEEWVGDWLAFFSELVGEPVTTDLGDSDDVEDLLTRVVEAFNTTQKWVTRARTNQGTPQVAYE
jgi:hypothetical protein